MATASPPNEEFFLTPYMPQAVYLRPAWLGCLRWALGEPEVLTAFRTETGQHWTPGRAPLDRMVDAATGADRAFFVAFAAWMNATIWGDV